jgi:hypothetical protein
MFAPRSRPETRHGCFHVHPGGTSQNSVSTPRDLFVSLPLVQLETLTSVFLLCNLTLELFAAPTESERASCRKSHFSKPSRFVGRYVLLIHICFQWRTTPKNRSAVIPRIKRPLAASAWLCPRMACREALTLEKLESRLHTAVSTTQLNSGMKVKSAMDSKTKWKRLMCRAAEGANALSDVINS